MRQGDFFRPLALLAVACAAAGLTVVGTALTGELGSTTTVEQYVAAPSTASGAAGGSGASSATLSIEQIYRLDAPGVVEISAATVSARRRVGSPGAQAASRPLGSGFVIDKAGHILTNSHIIAGMRRVQVSFSGNDKMNARIVGVDPASGVAVLQIDAHSRALAPLQLGDSDDVQVGDQVVAIGNPLSFTRTATAGIVSAVQRTIDPSARFATPAHAIETDAAINHGNSGGPLINARGEVIGVNAPVEWGASTGATIGLGFAIPIDTVKAVVAQMIHDRKVQHAFLGLSAIALSAPVARMFNLPSRSGLLVQAVVRDSSAGKAGLRAGSTAVVVAGETYRLGGDIIVSADGVPLPSTARLRDLIESRLPGDQIRLQIWRARKRETVLVVLGRPPG